MVLRMMLLAQVVFQSARLHVKTSCPASLQQGLVEHRSSKMIEQGKTFNMQRNRILAILCSVGLQ